MDRTRELYWDEGGSPNADSQAEVIHLAAMGDLHCPYTDIEFLKPIFYQIDKEADVLLLCGDLTHCSAPSVLGVSGSPSLAEGESEPGK